MAHCTSVTKSGESCKAQGIGDTGLCHHHGDAAHRCQATKKNGQRCMRVASVGRKVCLNHGGASLPGGPGHPRYQSGRYSQTLPERLRDTYEAAAVDKELLHHRNDVALIDTLLADTVGKLDTGESGERWGKVRKALTRYRRVRGTAEEDSAWSVLADLVESGANNFATQEEIGKLLDRRERIAKREREREIELKQTVSVPQLMTFMGQVVEAVQRTVTDRQQQMLLGAELMKLQNFVRHDTSLITARERKRLGQGEIIDVE